MFKPSSLVLILGALLLSQYSFAARPVIVEDGHSVGEGTYILLGISSIEPVKSITLGAERKTTLTQDYMRQRYNHILLKVSPGFLRVSQIELESLATYSLGRDLWSFDAIEGAINYIGTLEVQFGHAGFVHGPQISNMSSFAQEFMESKYPDVLEKKSLVYAGPGEDDFFSVIAKPKNDDEGSRD